MLDLRFSGFKGHGEVDMIYGRSTAVGYKLRDMPAGTGY